MARSRFRSSRGASGRDRATSVLLVAVGAAAGVAIGMLIADRAGGIDGLLRRGRGPNGARRASDDGWRGDERRSDAFDMNDDDETELSPESIAHLHMRTGRVGDTDHPLPVETARGDAGVARPLDGMGAATGRKTADRAKGKGADRGRATVRPLPVRPVPDDTELESRVLEAFLNDPVLRERAIDICATGPGTIELTGWVQASWEIGHALTLARGVPDVRTVEDRLAVRGPEPRRDHSGARYEPPGMEAGPARAD